MFTHSMEYHLNESIYIDIHNLTMVYVDPHYGITREIENSFVDNLG